MSQVKEIKNTGLLVSVHHNWSVSANLEVFDVSRKGQARKIYSFEEVSGSRIIEKIYLIIYSSLVTGYGGATYNPRRSILGAIPVGGKISYHLFNFCTPKNGNLVKLIGKSRWHSQYSTQDGIFFFSYWRFI